MHEESDVLISGASIAGPALAFWLRRHGFRVTVVERAPGPRPGGQTVDLRGAARTVVERMGLMSAVRDVRVDERGMAFVDPTGRRIAALPADAFGGEGVVSDIEVMRGDLTQILYDATREDVEYRFDDSISELVQDDRGVTVRFERGSEQRFALVVGADGLHSRVRALAFGPESSFVSGMGAYTSFFTVPNRYELDGWFLMYNEPNKALALRPDRTATEVKAMLSFRGSAPAVERGDMRGLQDAIADAFEGFGWVGQQVVADMPASTDFYFDSISQVHMDSWSTGRVALLGDAAFCGSPVSGLGTSMALVGAYVLAGELAAAQGDHAGGLAGYESILRPYVAQGQELPPGGVGGFLPGSRTGIALRARSLRMMTRWPMRIIAAKAFSKAEAIDLPDYGGVSSGVASG